MFHPDTQFLIDHWTALSRRPEAQAGIPERVALRPDALGLRLPRTFMVDHTSEGSTILLAGSWIETLHDETLKNRDLTSLWTSRSWPLVSAALAQTVSEGRPVVVSARVGSGSDQIEICLAPLRQSSGCVDRILGLYAPLKTLTLAANEPRLLTARVSIGVGDLTQASPNLAAVGRLRIAG